MPSCSTVFSLPFLLLTFALPAWAQILPSQAELKKRRDQKLASPFLKEAAWITNYDRARQEAKKSGKLIFAYFTRSYSP